MRPHRFVFNLGYEGTDSADIGMTSVGFVAAALLLELAFEFVVDFNVLSIEMGHGIDFEEFWKLVRKNRWAFIGKSLGSRPSVCILLQTCRLALLCLFCAIY